MKPADAVFMRMTAYLRIAVVAGLLLLVQRDIAAANPAEPELLDADQAFRVTAQWRDARTVELNYFIADGYYMYRDRFAFLVDGKPLKLAKSRFPAGRLKQDATFGRVVTYRSSVRLLLPVVLSDNASGDMRVVEVEATSQGCADIGVCYPPLRQRLRLPVGSRSEIGPDGNTSTTGFSRPANRGTLGELLKKGP